jgi:hypothetical protein
LFSPIRRSTNATSVITPKSNQGIGSPCRIADGCTSPFGVNGVSLAGEEATLPGIVVISLSLAANMRPIAPNSLHHKLPISFASFHR